MGVDRSRFQPVPGRARRFIDKVTGENVSYRRALTISRGMTPEAYAELRKELGVARPKSRKEWLLSELARRGEPVRGPKAERTRRVIAELEKRDLGARRREDVAGKNWLPVLYEEYGEDFWGDTEWESFFYPEVMQ